jgi:tellurite resistance protein TerC
MDVPFWVWSVVVAGIVVALLVDLLVFHRDAHEVSMKEAAFTSAVWIAVGVGFGIGVWVVAGGDRGGEWFAGYLIEKALAVDNIFVFAVILSAFAVPPALQHRVLFFGVLGALVLRAGFIAVGASLIDTFSWVLYLFGAFLVFTGVKLARGKAHEIDPNHNLAVRLTRRLVPVSDHYDGTKFFVKLDGRRVATPLLVVLLAIESSDVVFAVDSIPAIFAVTSEPFIVFTSNAFAILGLRALYFLLAGAVHRFQHLGKGLAAILVFVGVKMLIVDHVHLPVGVSLAVIALILTIAIGASLRVPQDGDGAPDDGAQDGRVPDGLSR